MKCSWFSGQVAAVLRRGRRDEPEVKQVYKLEDLQPNIGSLLMFRAGLRKSRLDNLYLWTSEPHKVPDGTTEKPASGLRPVSTLRNLLGGPRVIKSQALFSHLTTRLASGGQYGNHTRLCTGWSRENAKSNQGFLSRHRSCKGGRMPRACRPKSPKVVEI